MFTLSEIEIIMQKRKEKMITLLRDLGFKGVNQNWQEEFDSFLTDKICSLMKSDSVFEGYSFLLRAADIPQSYSETENEKLAKIVAHRAEIERCIIMSDGPVSPQYERRFTVRNTGSNPLTYLLPKLENIDKLFTRLEVVVTKVGKMQKIQENDSFRTEIEDIRRKIKGLDHIIEKLQRLRIVSVSEPSDSWKEEEFMSFIEHNSGNFLVSVSREKVTSRPDPSEQYRKFTEQEARNMLDILERLNDIVSGI